jgi:CubicO group peptidase (beta-lactamase class C family)
MIRFATSIILAALFAMGSDQPTAAQEKPEAGDEYRGFGAPQRVTIRGYDGHAMEPFFTRDGRYLLFNNLNDPKENTNLHYAERKDDLTFEYKGEIKGVNTAALEGVPSMDKDGMLYFVSTIMSYDKTFSTLYRRRFKDGAVTGVELVPGVSRKQPGIVNFDVEISADGKTLYFVDGEFTKDGSNPKTADIVIAVLDGKEFNRDPKSSTLRNHRNSQVSRRQALRVIAGAGAGLGWMASADRASADELPANKKMEVWTRPEWSAAEWRELGLDPKGVESLAAAFRSQLEKNRHPGAQLALCRNGKLILEMGGGIARKTPEQKVTPETMFVLFSCTKAWSATAAHMLIERGKLKLDAKVADYWPEFAKHGKEAVTVYHALSHRGGYPAFSLDLTDLAKNDPKIPAKALEESKLSWKPGEANGYHGGNFGEAVAELVRRVDGRVLSTFLREEVFEKIAMPDSYLGLPADKPGLDDRVAYLYEMENNTPGAAFRFRTDAKDDVAEWKFVWNRPEVHRMSLPSGGGISTAHDFAHFYGMLANGGEIDGVRLLRKETIETAVKRSNAPGEIDRSFRMAMPWGLGFMLGGDPKLPFSEGPALRRSSAASARDVRWAGPIPTATWASPI